MGRQNRWQPGWLRPLLILGVMCVSLALSASPARALVNLSSADLTGWTPVTPANGQHDYLTDQQTSSGQSVPQDIVGDNVYRSAYVKYDDNGTPGDISDDWLGFRVRVNNTNSTNPVSSGFDKFGFFGVDHGLDGDIDFFVGVYNPSHSSQGKIGVYDANGAGNTGPSDTGIAGSSSVTYNSDTTDWSSMWSFVQATDGSSFSGQADYFISFQVKVADINTNKATFGIASDITKDTTLRYIVGTAAQDNAFNQDISGMQGWSSSGTWASLGVFTPVVNADGSTPPNTAPTFVGVTTTLTVNEGAAATSVKDLLHVSDTDAGQTVTWTVYSAPSKGTLNISGATASSGSADITPGGTITYQPTANTTDSDSFVIQVSDVIATATRTISVTINDVNPDISNATVSLAENSPNGTAVTTVTATGDTDGLAYSITGGNTSNAFAINSSTGAITVASSSALDYETTPTFTLTVAVDDEDADSTADDTATITINLTNVNEAPSRLAITSAPVSGPASNTARLGPITVQLQDASGNPVNAGSGGVTVSLSSNSTGTKVFSATNGGSAVTSVTIPSGSSSVSFYYGDTKAGAPTITAASPGLTSATQIETVTASKLAITSAAVSGGASSTAGLGPITVQLQDASGNAVTAGTGGVTVSLSSNTAGTAVFSATSGGSAVTSVTIPSGSSSVSFYYGDTKADTPTITAASSGLTSATQVETITAAGAASKLAITSTVVSGAASSTATLGPITVQLQDAFGNPVTAGSGGVTVNLSSNSTGTKVFSATSGGSAVTSVTIPSGSNSTTFYYGDTNAGTPTITAAATGLGSATRTMAIFATASRLVITTDPVSGMASSAAKLGPIMVQIQDASGRAVKAGAGGVTVNLSSASSGGRFAETKGGTSVTSVTIPRGSTRAIFYYGDTQAGTPTITASATNLTSATQTETISDTATKLVFTTPARDGTASSTTNLGPITVQLQNAANSPVNAGPGGVTVNLSSNTQGKAVFATVSGAAYDSVSAATYVTIPSGSNSVSFYYADTKAGTLTITAASTGLTSATQDETVNPGTAAKLAITSSPLSGSTSATATLGPVTVQLQDAYGNAVTAGGGGVTVNLSSNSTGTAVFSASSGGSTVTSVTIPNGSSSVNFYYGDTQAGTPTITAASTDLTSATQKAFIGAANAFLELTAVPSSIVGDGLSTSTLRIRLVDSNGTGLAGVPVSLTATAGSLSSATPNTGADGTVFVTLTAPLIQATTPRTERVIASVYTDSLRAFQTIEITFLPATIRGVIVDRSTGLAIPGAEVWVNEDFDGNGSIDFTATAVTAGDGSYEIVVPRGNWPYKVNFRAPVKVGNRTVNIESTQTSQVGQLRGIGEKVNADKTISGVLLALDGQATQSIAGMLTQGATVTGQIRTSSGDTVAQSVYIDANGAFKVDGVADGDYKLSFKITRNGGELIGPTVSVSVSHVGEAALSVALIDPFGVVTDATTGQPISGVNMNLYWANTAANIAAGRTPDTLVPLPALPEFPPNQNANPQQTNALGSYAWMVFPDGDYYLTATRSGYATFDSRQDTRSVVFGNSYVQNGVIHVGTDMVEFNVTMQPLSSSSTPAPAPKTGEHKRYIRGYPDGSFRPERSISRAEVATILARIRDVTDGGEAFGYPDVYSRHWAVGFIRGARKVGLMTGDPDGRFRPDEPISRAEVAAIAVRFKSLSGQAGNAFSDIEGHWGRGAIGLAFQAQILEGFPDGTFQADKPASRAEFVTIMNRILGRGPLTGRAAPRWGDVPWSYWAAGQVEEASISHTFTPQPDGSERWTADIADGIR